MDEKTTIPFVGEVAVGDTIQFPGDPAYYAVLGINEDGIVCKKLNMILLAEEVINANSELLESLSDDK